MSTVLRRMLALGWALVVLGATTGVLALIFLDGRADGRADRAQVWGTALGVLALLPPVLAWAWKQVRKRSELGEADLAIMAAALRVETLRRVQSGPSRIRLRRPIPLTVRFRSSATVGARRRAVTGERDIEWIERPLTGTSAEIATQLRDLPWRQLVVLGKPGAGKSVLASMLVEQLLTEPLAEESGHREPVPVLLRLSGWNLQEKKPPRVHLVSA